ncbi:hypothetical protein MASR1M65_18810 [Saprospiraceae bacterium]
MEYKKKILVLYEYFYPGYKAGGPIQSIVNMVLALQHQYDFFIATTAYDMLAEKPYPGIASGKWTDVSLLEGTNLVKVWYSSAKKPSFSELLHVIRTSRCDTLYINGFYTNHSLFPLLYTKLGLLKGIRCIVAPRGMLQQGALQIGALKKKVYFKIIKLLGLTRQISFHATTPDEEIDIMKMFGSAVSVIVAENIPKTPYSIPNCSRKQAGCLNLVFLSLITEKKNLLLLLETLKMCTQTIRLDIFGPVKDRAYWQLCLQTMGSLPGNVVATYKGEVLPADVQQTLAAYNAMILLTKGENFGHAIYESLSVGTPVITSHFTPWNDLQMKMLVGM